MPRKNAVPAPTPPPAIVSPNAPFADEVRELVRQVPDLPRRVEVHEDTHLEHAVRTVEEHLRRGGQ